MPKLRDVPLYDSYGKFIEYQIGRALSLVPNNNPCLLLSRVVKLAKDIYRISELLAANGMPSSW